MEIKKETKWTCIEDVIIGYNLRIFNASENYESPSDNHLIDNLGKVRYVSSAWYDNFVAIPAGRKTGDKIPQVENRGTTSPNIDKESNFMSGDLNIKKKDLQKDLGNVEGMSDKEIVDNSIGDFWKALEEGYEKKEYTEHLPKLNYTQGNRGTHLGNPPLNEKRNLNLKQNDNNSIKRQN